MTMNREILFRGFYESESGNEVITINGRKIKGIWVYGFYCFSQKRRGAFGQTVSELDSDTHYIVFPRGESCKVIPETVGQYTGLTDKNGKKIFEEDIVKVSNKFIDYVVFDCGCFNIERQVMNYEFTYQNFKNIEVIGNIYDNPELLKENDND